MDPRHDKLDAALRANRARLVRGEWMRRMSEACGLDVAPRDFFPPDETESLKRGFVERLSSGVGVARRNWPIGSEARLAVSLGAMAREIGPVPVVVFGRVDADLGAMRLPADACLRNFPAVWEVVGQDFVLLGPDLRDCIGVGKEFHDLEGNHVRDGILEVVTWGRFPQPA